MTTSRIVSYIVRFTPPGVNESRLWAVRPTLMLARVAVKKCRNNWIGSPSPKMTITERVILERIVQ